MFHADIVDRRNDGIIVFCRNRKARSGGIYRKRFHIILPKNLNAPYRIVSCGQLEMRTVRESS